MLTHMSDRWRVAALAALLLAGRVGNADQVKLNVALGHRLLKADRRQTTYLKVGLTGFTLESGRERTPVNLVIVLDQSGSMQGDKIRKAKEAAVMAVNRLTRRDIVSVVTYSSTVHVLVPATKLTDKATVCAAIRRLQAGGSTALFAGVSKGAQELRKFIDRNRVNRVVLLSDGLANVGPSSPHELGQLGASLIKEGISVTTIGLGMGYNEDLMAKLAFKSDGNHYFAENATDLARVFDKELGDVLTVVAQEIVVTIECAPGIRPVRVLGREADITGQAVIAKLNQLYSEQEKYVLLEVEVPATSADQTREVVKVNVSYANMQTKTTDTLASRLAVRFTHSTEAIARETNGDVMVAAVEQVATSRNVLAVRLRDQGRIEEARKVLTTNWDYLRTNADKWGSKKLRSYADANRTDADNLEGANWTRQRKSMRAGQMENMMQQQQ